MLLSNTYSQPPLPLQNHQQPSGLEGARVPRWQPQPDPTRQRHHGARRLRLEQGKQGDVMRAVLHTDIRHLGRQRRLPQPELRRQHPMCRGPCSAAGMAMQPRATARCMTPCRRRLRAPACAWWSRGRPRGRHWPARTTSRCRGAAWPSRPMWLPIWESIYTPIHLPLA